MGVKGVVWARVSSSRYAEPRCWVGRPIGLLLGLAFGAVGCGESPPPSQSFAPAVPPSATTPASVFVGSSQESEVSSSSAIAIDPESVPTQDAAETPNLKAPDGTLMLACGPAPVGMACIAGGKFLRGSDEGPDNTKPQGSVWLQTFYMDVNEVTNEQYDRCEAEKSCTKSGPQYLDFDRPKQPINGISWFDAEGYCRAQGKHLPTEAQWEKAARGTDGRTYPWGEEPATCERAIIKGKEGRGCGLLKRGSKPKTGRVWEIGSRPANLYGLHDMAGNSFEWVADWFTRSYEACGEDCQGVDPKGPCDGAEDCPGYKHKGVRGGSWYWGPDRATTFFRRAHVPRNRPFHHFGFRCAADLTDPVLTLPLDERTETKE